MYARILYLIVTMIDFKIYTQIDKLTISAIKKQITRDF